MLLRTRGLLVVSSTLIKGATTTTTTNNNNAKVSILYSKRKRKNGNSCTFNLYGNIKGAGKASIKRNLLVADMSANWGEGWKEKTMQNAVKRKICILKEFNLF